MSKTSVLLTGPMTPRVLEGVTAAFDALRLWEAPDRDAFLRERGAAIRGIACNGAHGAIGAALFDALPALEIVSNFGVGYDNVDVVEAERRGIVVTNTPDVLTDEVADLTLGLLIATVRQIPRAEQHVRTDAWAKSAFPLTATLRGRSVGIVGLGRIGKAIARRIEGFGLPVSYHGRSRQPDVAYPYHASVVELARAVDVLIVITPGGEGTRRMIDAEVLAALGPDGVLVNVARGSVVDEDALIAALREKRILAAGLDVYENEPNIRQDFLSLDNAVLLPHVASGSVHTRNAMSQLVVDNLVAWFDGRGALSPVPEHAALAVRRGRG
jgi:lactate dehydrogenase-like 2-hydroxyacid dehydrogenase